MASIIYWTDFPGNAIYQTDLGSLATTLVEHLPVGSTLPDSIILDNAGDLLYTCKNSGAGQIRKYNLTTLTDTAVSSGLGTKLVDLCLDPGGLTCLTSDQTNTLVVRVNLGTGAQTTLATIALPNGIAYDNAGRLFVCTYDGVHGQIVQLNPTTGAVIATSANVNANMDGLCFDPFSGLLWAAFGGQLQPCNPATLALGTPTTAVSATFDGVASAQNGILYACDNSIGAIRAYSIPGGTWSTAFSAPNCDDLCISVALSIACNNPGPAITGEPYSAAPSASGGTAPYTYSIPAGALPPGLAINPATGAITGIPRNTGVYSFTVQAVDSASGTSSVACSIRANTPGTNAGGVGLNPGLAAPFILKKLTVGLKRDPHFPVRGAN